MLMRNYTQRTKCILALHKNCSQNLLEISNLYGYKFGKLSVAPYLGDLASTLKNLKNLNYDSTTVMATSISNTILINAFMNSSYLYHGN